MKKCRFSLFNIYYILLVFENVGTRGRCMYCVIVFSAYRVIYIQVYSLPNAQATRMFNNKTIQRINIM